MEGLPSDCAGLLELQAPPPLWISAVLGDRVLESRLHDASSDEIVFVLERDDLDQRWRGGLRARIVDAETGAPLEGSAALTYQDMSGGGPPIQPDGIVEFQDEIVGLRELELMVRDHERLLRTVRLRPGETIDLGTIALHRQRAIRGHLADERGQPVSAALTWTPADLLASPLDIYQRVFTRTAGDGSFELGGAGRGEVLLFVQGGEFAANPIRIPAGEDADVDAVARRGTLVVIRPLRDAGPGARFTVAGEEGRAFWSTNAREQFPLRLRLVPGTYQLWTGRDELVEGVETFTVGGETLVLER